MSAFTVTSPMAGLGACQMAEFPMLPLWTDAFIADTTHLDAKETGAYLMLLIVMWRTKDCALPDDDKLLHRYARLSLKEWRRIRPIMEPFFVIEGGCWSQKRLSKEWRRASRRAEVNRIRSSQGGKAKALKLKKQALPKEASKQCLQPAHHLHLQKTPQSPPGGERVENGFDQFWETYPRKAAKARARKAWEKAIKLKSAKEIISALKKHVAYWSASQRPPEKIPHPATWLNGESWNDVLPNTDHSKQTLDAQPSYDQAIRYYRDTGVWVLTDQPPPTEH